MLLWHYFKLPKECLATTAPCSHFEVWPSAVSSLWGHRGHLFCDMSLPAPHAGIALQFTCYFPGVHNDANMLLSCLWTQIIFYTQRKAVTEHRYLTCPCRDILIQWEQSRVMYCSIVLLWIWDFLLPSVVCSGPEVTAHVCKNNDSGCKSL